MTCPHTGLEPQTREVKVNGSGSPSHQVRKNNSIIYFKVIVIYASLTFIIKLLCGLTLPYCPFGYERVYLTLCKVADTPFHIQRDDFENHFYI